MIKVTTPNFDKVREELTKALDKLKTDKFVTIGVHESENNRGESMTNARLGAIQHFGNDKIPARPWLDVGVASVTDEIIDTLADSAEDGEPFDQALERAGVVAVAGVQNYMDELSIPSNAASTIKKKGTNNPLIDTGELKQSVTYKTTNGQPSEGI